MLQKYSRHDAITFTSVHIYTFIPNQVLCTVHIYMCLTRVLITCIAMQSSPFDYYSGRGAEPLGNQSICSCIYILHVIIDLLFTQIMYRILANTATHVDLNTIKNVNLISYYYISLAYNAIICFLDETTVVL